MSDLNQIVQSIADLPRDWHGAGTVSAAVLRAIVRHTEGMKLAHSAETGTGKTSLLLSHLCPDHRIFANRDDSGSVEAVLGSPLFAAERAQVVEGPTQQTLPRFKFEHPLDLVLLDGPHGFPFVEMEYWHFYPQLDTGALLILDDIHIATCYNLYCFIREDEMFEELERVGSTAFFRRTDAPLLHPMGDGWWLQNYNKSRHPVDLENTAREKGLDEQIGELQKKVEELRQRIEQESAGEQSLSTEQMNGLAAVGRQLLNFTPRRGWRRLLSR